MPADPCDAVILILSASHGGTDLGMCVGFRHRYSIQRVTIPGPGKTGPTCKPIIRRDYNATVRFLVGPPIVPDTSGSLVLTGIDGGGDNHAVTITTMLADGYEQAVDVNSPPGAWDQDFTHKGDMASDPRSGS